MKPKDVDEKKEEFIIMDRNRQLLEIQESEGSVKVNDFVRIKLKKALFSKLGRNYSQEIYKVIKVNKFSVKLENYDKLVKIEDIQVVPVDTINQNKLDNQIQKVENDYKVMTSLRRKLGLPLSVH